MILDLVAPAAGATPTDQLRERVERVLEILGDPSLRESTRAAERRTAISQIARGLFDFEEMARRALGRHWQARTPAERAEFVPLFADLLEEVYLGRIEQQYSGEKVAYLGETIEDDRATVKTVIQTSRAKVPIDYRMTS